MEFKLYLTVCEADNWVSRKKRSGLRITFDDRKEIRSVMAEKKTNTKLIANNKKAYHDYFIEDTWEAGISLAGTEVKSLRMGKCSIKESFIRTDGGEVTIYGMHISPYEKGNIFNKDPLRPRRLLLHKSEINRLTGRIAQQGYTIVPLKVYFKGSLVKVEIGLAKGKKLLKISLAICSI